MLVDHMNVLLDAGLGSGRIELSMQASAYEMVLAFACATMVQAFVQDWKTAIEAMEDTAVEEG